MPSPGESLREWRKGQGLTQTDAAKLIGVNQATWCEYEQDKKVPSAPVLFGIEKVTRGVVPARNWANAGRSASKVRKATRCVRVAS